MKSSVSRRSSIAAFSLLLPVALLYGLALAVPFVTMAIRSVRALDGGWSTSAYIDLLHSYAFRSVLGTSVWVALVVTFWCVVLGYPLAYMAAKLKSRQVRGFILALVVLPILTGALIRSFAWIAMLEDGGVVNAVLIGVGLIDSPVQLVYNRIGLYIGMVSVLLPYAILPMVSTMSAIDPLLTTAASSLGASRYRRFVHVFLPLSISGVTAGALLTFILSIGFYITPALLGGRKETMIAQLIESRVTGLGDFVGGSAMAMVVMFTVVVMIFLYARFFDLGDLFGQRHG